MFTFWGKGGGVRLLIGLYHRPFLSKQLRKVLVGGGGGLLIVLYHRPNIYCYTSLKAKEIQVFYDMMVSTITLHFGSTLVESLEIISSFQDGWLHDTTINIHLREIYRNQESKKNTKSFSEDIQMCCTFKKSYSAVPK